MTVWSLRLNVVPPARTVRSQQQLDPSMLGNDGPKFLPLPHMPAVGCNIGILFEALECSSQTAEAVSPVYPSLSLDPPSTGGGWGFPRPPGNELAC